MTGAEQIAAERLRQMGEEGWTAEHDDEHTEGEMALVAALYATPMTLYQFREYEGSLVFEDAWPWDIEWDKRMQHDRKRRLVIAGALIAAEIDRLQRMENDDG